MISLPIEYKPNWKLHKEINALNKLKDILYTEKCFQLKKSKLEILKKWTKTTQNLYEKNALITTVQYLVTYIPNKSFI